QDVARAAVALLQAARERHRRLGRLVVGTGGRLGRGRGVVGCRGRSIRVVVVARRQQSGAAERRSETWTECMSSTHGCPPPHGLPCKERSSFEAELKSGRAGRAPAELRRQNPISNPTRTTLGLRFWPIWLNAVDRMLLLRTSTVFALNRLNTSPMTRTDIEGSLNVFAARTSVSHTLS